MRSMPLYLGQLVTVKLMVVPTGPVLGLMDSVRGPAADAGVEPTARPAVVRTMAASAATKALVYERSCDGS